MSSAQNLRFPGCEQQHRHCSRVNLFPCAKEQDQGKSERVGRPVVAPQAGKQHGRARVPPRTSCGEAQAAQHTPAATQATDAPQ